MHINQIAGMSHQELMSCISEKKKEIAEKVKNGETEPTFAIGAESYTAEEWDKLIAKVDRNNDAVRKEQEQRKEAWEKEFLEEKKADQTHFLSIMEAGSTRRHIIMEKMNGTYQPSFPYEAYADGDTITYNGVLFVGDKERNAICLGDMSNKGNVLTIPLEGGGSLMVNRDSIGMLAGAMSMFSPEDANRIMRAIADDKKAQDTLNEIEDDKNSLGDDADDKVIDQMIADLIRDREDGENTVL